MQSCLEKRGIEARNANLVRSEYNRYNQYDENHENARATGDAKGKGTGHGGHSHWLPNCEGDINVINYSNFDTNHTSGAGNDKDNEARDTALTRCLYGPENPYSETIVDTSASLAEGQYYVH